MPQVFNEIGILRAPIPLSNVPLDAHRLIQPEPRRREAEEKLTFHCVDQIDDEAIRLWNDTHHSLMANEKEGAPGACEPSSLQSTR